jgi:parallel beta-helix repeat protein
LIAQEVHAMPERSLLHKTLPLILLLLVAGRQINAATYDVATDGNDSNPGTEARPWKTLQKAAASVGPGDVVRIGGGEHFVGPTLRIDRAGKEGSPITYTARGDGQPRITNSTIIPAGAWTHVKGGIYSTPITQPAFSVFRDALPLHGPGDRAKIFSVDEMIPNSFYVSDQKTLYVWLEDGSHPKDSVMRASPGHVISLYDCSHSIFEGLIVEYGFNGFKLQSDATHHITIRACVISSMSSQGIQPVARDCVIEYNTFQEIGANKYQHGIYGSQAGTIIRHNVFREIAGAGIHQYSQGEPAGGDCQFHGNEFRKPRKMTVRSGKDEYYLDIIAWGQGGNRIYNNVFYGEGKRGGISLNSDNNQVYHNTFVGCTYGIEFHAGKTGNRVMNNIIQDADRSFLIWPAKSLPQTLDHNLYHSTSAAPRWERDGVTYPTFADYQRAAGESHSLYDDPGLKGGANARPRPGSPAIDAAALLKEVAADFVGVSRPQGAASDIGAFEAKSLSK